MMRFFAFRLQFWPSLIALPAILVMIGLSFWQVERLQWKEALIADRKARLEAPPIAFPALGADLKAMEFRRLHLAGTFRHDREFYVMARSLNGNVGLWVVTPFATEAGALILVNRGWVPADRQDPARRAEGQIAGPVTIDAILRLPQRQSWLQPPNEPQKNRWFYLAPGEMAASSGLDLRTDFYLDAAKADIPGGFPIGGQTRTDLPNDHLQYAITWAALAIAFAFVYILYHRRNFPLELPPPDKDAP